MSEETPMEQHAAPMPGIADPAPLGLAGFAMTTMLLSFINAHVITEPLAVEWVLGLALFYGGIGQFVAGLWEYRRGNTFGATAFCSFGAFWLSFWAVNRAMPAGGADTHQMLGAFLLAWGLFTAYMTVAALKTSRAVLAVFVFLTLTFLVLGIGAFQTSSNTVTEVGGWLGVVTALLAWYASAGAVINQTHKREVLPTWPV